MRFDQVLPRRHQTFDLAFYDVAALLRHFQIADDFGKTEHAHCHIGKADAVGQFGDIESHATSAGLKIRPNHRQQKASEDHSDGLEDRALGKDNRENETQHHQRKILGRTEQKSNRRKRHTKRRHQNCRDASGEERANGSDRERRTGAALPRHLMAVETRYDRCRLTRNIDEHRRGRAAILGAIVNAGKHDQRPDRRQSECDREQHGNRRDGADARKHTDQCANECAKQAKSDVVRVSGDREAESKVGQKFTHDVLSSQYQGQS